MKYPLKSVKEIKKGNKDRESVTLKVPRCGVGAPAAAAGDDTLIKM